MSADQTSVMSTSVVSSAENAPPCPDCFAIDGCECGPSQSDVEARESRMYDAIFHECDMVRGTETLRLLAKSHPDSIVKLYFKNSSAILGYPRRDDLYGSLVTTASNAVNPNRSQRFFPGENETPVMLGWRVPYWYASECYAFSLVQMIGNGAVIGAAPMSGATVLVAKL